MNKPANKMEFVRKLRKINDGSLLEKVVGHMEEKLTGNELEMLYAAAHYRRAEIVMNQYFDKVPGNVWKYVR